MKKSELKKLSIIVKDNPEVFKYLKDEVRQEVFKCLFNSDIGSGEFGRLLMKIL